MKTFFSIIGVIVLALVVWVAVDSRRPKLFADVKHVGTDLVITNGNDRAWHGTMIRLNDITDLIERAVPVSWNPGETRTIPLASFFSETRKQKFNPEFETLREVVITVDGYQMGIYEVHR